MIASAIMVSYQTAGKAARDAIFLTHYEIGQLPAMVIAAAAATIVVSLLSTGWMSRFGPAVLVSRAFLVSGILQFAEWAVLSTAPRIVAPVVYLHIASLTAILASGFWSILSEEVQLRQAKQFFVRVATWGTVGGICGGLVAERMAAWLGTNSVLLQLGVAHVACAAILWRTVNLTRHGATEESADFTPWKAFSQVPYLATLALLILLGTASGAALDFLFKAQAREVLGRGPDLLRFLALFQTATSVFTILLQWFISRFVTSEKVGLTLLTSSVPAVVGIGGIASAFLPGLPTISITRLLEAATRVSLFRNGYELFYSPIAPKEKRAVKTFIDVVCDRLGDATSSVVVQTALTSAPTVARYLILGSIVVLSAICLRLSARLDKAFHQVVERGLLNRADELGFGSVVDSATLSSQIASTSHPDHHDSADDNLAPYTPSPFAPSLTEKPQATDPILETLRELRSGNFRRIEAALGTVKKGPIDANLAPAMIGLLARDDSANAVRRILSAQAGPYTGLMLDFLLDPLSEFPVRRRLPSILNAYPSARVAAGLLNGLGDDQFEVRFQCARALDHMRAKLPSLQIDRNYVFTAVVHEVTVNKSIWDSRRLLDHRDTDDEFSFLDEVLRDRAHQSLEHVFTLLALVLPREPVRTAFRALHSGDRALSDLALQYLERAVPAQVRQTLWPVLENRSVTNIPADVREKAARDILLTERGLLLALKKVDETLAGDENV